MGWRLAADFVLVVHMGFVVFIVAGGLLVRRRRWVAAPHLASLVYGGVIQLIGFTCPLTPFENDLRRTAGDSGYDGGFVEHALDLDREHVVPDHDRQVRICA